MRVQRKALLLTLLLFVVGTGFLVNNVFEAPQINAEAQTDESQTQGTVEDSEWEGKEERFNITEFINLVHEEVSERRSEEELESLVHDKNLSLISQSHSVRMESTDTVSDVNGETRKPRDRLEARGYDCDAVAQNVLSASTTTLDEEEVAMGVVENWMLDETARSNILNKEHESHGIGAVHEDGRLYVTQLLC